MLGHAPVKPGDRLCDTTPDVTGAPVASVLLRAESIAKSFAGVHALRGVSFDLRAGEVHALVGENGAGKSTLIKIATGAESMDNGALTIAGRAVTQMNPRTARALGITAIYQQPALFPHLTVAENMALGLEHEGLWRRVDWRRRRQRAAECLQRTGASFGVDRLIETLTMPEQQLVEIAKAIGAEAKILILDEPTASLTDREVERLFSVIRLLRERGVGIVYISHRLEEVLALADRITVMRDGEIVATRPTRDLQRAELVRLMVGRRTEGEAAGRPAAADAGDVVLELRHVTQRALGVRDVSLVVKAGEILGMAGLVGSGRTQVAQTIFGLARLDSGEIRVGGVARRIHTPEDAIRLRIGYVPEDRPLHGVVEDMSIAGNVTLANLSAISRIGFVDTASERSIAQRYVGELRIKTPSVDAKVRSLSGGNQQKVALARWLSIDPAVLMLDEPTQGVDVGSKVEIHEIIRGLAGRGVAILMISSELPEILAMSDRIAVMRAGTIAGVMSRLEATQQNILSLALGDRGRDGQDG
jgi:rhamnose transport system ATP-binding protein